MSINKKLDVKTLLHEDEVLFAGINKGGALFKLNQNYNIKTVEDFINFDFKNTKLSKQSKLNYIAYQRILRSKYLNQPLEIEDILRKPNIESLLTKYNSYGVQYQLDRNFRQLGFLGYGGFVDGFSDYVKEKLDNKDYDISIIGFLSKSYNHYINRPPIFNNICRPLTIFYVEYYNEHLKEEPISESNEIVSTNNIALDFLKKERADLIKMRDNLNEKIDLLSEKIDYLENKTNKSLKMTLKDE